MYEDRGGLIHDMNLRNPLRSEVNRALFDLDLGFTHKTCLIDARYLL